MFGSTHGVEVRRGRKALVFYCPRTTGSGDIVCACCGAAPAAAAARRRRHSALTAPASPGQTEDIDTMTPRNGALCGLAVQC
eukprot:5714233-Prymnesium_polylepis.1